MHGPIIVNIASNHYDQAGKTKPIRCIAVRETSVSRYHRSRYQVSLNLIENPSETSRTITAVSYRWVKGEPHAIGPHYAERRQSIRQAMLFFQV